MKKAVQLNHDIAGEALRGIGGFEALARWELLALAVECVTEVAERLHLPANRGAMLELAALQSSLERAMSRYD